MFQFGRAGTTGLVAGLCLLAVPVAAEAGARVFRSPPADRSPAAEPVLCDSVTRARLVELDAPSLRAEDADAPELVFELFDGREVRASRWPADRLSGSVSAQWYGRLEGQGSGYALFVERAGVLAGKIQTDAGELFEIVWVGPDLYQLREVDPAALPPCSCGPEHAVHAGPELTDDEQVLALESIEHQRRREAIERGEEPIPSGDDRANFKFADVLIVYTPGARTVAGGAPQIQAAIELAIADANLAYGNSQTTIRIRAASIQEIAYTESNNLSLDLSRLWNGSDGFMDGVSVTRNSTSADMVALIVSQSAGGSCGAAYLMSTVAPAFESQAFSVTALNCLSSQTLTHELGHLMGCAHDRDNAPTQGAFSYSYGYRNPGQTYRTIMAYAPGLRTPNFSSPVINFPNGQPTGILFGEPGEAYNALTLTQSATVVSEWRTKWVAGPESFNLLAPVGGVTTANRSPLLTWTESSRRDYFQVIIDDDPNFNSPQIDAQPVITTSYQVPEFLLQSNVTYYWRVRAWNNLNVANSTPSIGSFVTPANAPGAFALTSPAQGSTTSLRPTFEWAPSVDRDSYRIIVDNNADFSSPVLDVSGLDALEYFMPSGVLAPQTVYHWRVIASNAIGSTTSTPSSRSFSTIGQVPGAFALLSPADGSNIGTVVPTIQWQSANLADTYTLRIALDVTMTNLVYTRTGLTETSHTVDPGVLQNDIRYYWRVTAVNDTGSTGSTPNTASFGVLLTPCPGDSNDDRTVNFADLVSTLSYWGIPGNPGDANGDGQVNFTDVTSVLSNWGSQCP